MARRWWFALAVALQVAVLLGLAGTRHYILATGQRVLLRTLPVDPRDLFRGDYVALRYEISELTDLAEPLRSGATVWVVLAPGDRYWRAVAVHPTQPAVAPGQVAVRGRVQWYDSYGRRAWVTYGIESFYVPEGEGRLLERPEVQLDVEAAVDRFGRAAIVQVLLDGQPLRWE